MFRNKSASSHQFAMVPRADIPRAAFRMEHTHKTTFDAGYLVPILVEEVLPGDTFNVKMTAFARLATPLFPIMDNLHLETFFFFVPNRLVWANWKKFMGEQTNPGDSISYAIPQVVSSAGGFAVTSIYDYMGLPTVGQVAAGATVSVNSLPLRAYNLIYNTWFRDENLINSQNGVDALTSDGPDTEIQFALKRRGKRHDYFTSCLPWPQKGNTSVSLPLGTSAPVKAGGTSIAGAQPYGMRLAKVSDGSQPANNYIGTNTGIVAQSSTAAPGMTGNELYPANLYADLAGATAATINQLRQAFQIQKLLERDARGGTRYTELIQSHFGVRPPDYRLQRPEYVGGGRTEITTHPIAQTSSTDATTPQGNLAGFTQAHGGNHRFNYAATEHGYLIGLANVRCDLTYQQGIRRHWSRSTRYDFYFPAFAHLGEQSILSKEIFADGTANDETVFGYQERWAEYRYTPNEIKGLFRSIAASNIDIWHYSEQFSARPTLNNTFITDPSETTLARSLAVGEDAAGQQILLDIAHRVTATRPMPTYSVPGLIDHF